MKNYKAVPLSGDRYLLGESPFWDPRTGTLSFVDITAQKFCFFKPGGEIRELNLGQMIGTALPCDTPGTYLLCMTDGLCLTDTETLKVTRYLDLRDVYKPWQRSNDCKADPHGRLYFGSSCFEDARGFNGDLRLLDKGEISILQPDTKISNGMAWSSDEKEFFFSDTIEHKVFKYDYDPGTGKISNRRVLFEPENGMSDGLCIDSTGNIWVAHWDGNRIESRSGRDGSLLATVEVPAKNVTSCCFCGPELKDLFITTSGDGLTGEHDGKLFICRTDVKGLGPDYFIP